MIDSFDYKEPSCALCGGKEFYNPKIDLPDGRIPVDRIIAKIDACFNKNNFGEAGRLLEYWKNEAITLKDKMGELSIQNELIGYYRKINNQEKAQEAIDRALILVELLEQSKMASGATTFLNCATAYKAFGYSEKAITLYSQAEGIYKSVLPMGDVKFGGLYNNMALALVDLDRFVEAEKAYLNAIAVMEKIQNGQADLAITYVNMAHMYERTKEDSKITDCLFKAYQLLNADELDRNGYYAYVCEKCAPSFSYFGYEKISEQLNIISRDIYEGN